MIRNNLLAASRRRSALSNIADRDEVRKETRLANSWDLSHIPDKGQKCGMTWDLTKPNSVSQTNTVYPEEKTFRVKPHGKVSFGTYFK